MRAATENNAQAVPMDRAYIDEHDVIQRYIRRTLTEGELNQFEIYMLSHAAIIEEIEQQRMLNQLFREELPKANRALTASQNPLYRFRHAISLAACLVVAVYAGLNIRDRASQDSAANVATLDALVLQDLRGASNTFTVTVPANATGASQINLPLKIDVGPQLEPVLSYNVYVRSDDGKTTIAEQQDRKASADGWLELGVALPMTLPANYQVEVVEFPGEDRRSYSVSLQ